LQRRKTDSPADPPPCHAVGVFMKDHFRIQVSIAIGIRLSPNEHLHTPRFTIGRRRKIRVGKEAAVLSVGVDGIVALATAAEIVPSKISGSLREPTSVQSIIR